MYSFSVKLIILAIFLTDLQFASSSTPFQLMEDYSEMFNRSTQCGGVRSSETAINRRSTCPW